MCRVKIRVGPSCLMKPSILKTRFYLNPDAAGGKIRMMKSECRKKFQIRIPKMSENPLRHFLAFGFEVSFVIQVLVFGFGHRHAR